MPSPLPPIGRSVPSLVSLTADVVARHAHSLRPEHLQFLGEYLSTLILSHVIANKKLDYYVAKTFLESGHETIVEALGELDLLAGISAVAPSACRPSKGPL